MSDEQKKNRRELLSSGALAAAGALFAGLAVACGDDGDEKPVTSVDGGLDGGGDAATHNDAATIDAAAGDAGAPASDVSTLNALLSAEYTAIAAYTAGGTLITNAPSTDPLASLRSTILAIATNIAGQHTLHAAALSTAIQGLGGTPVAQSSITFTPPAGLTANPTIMNVLKFATGAERNAAIAYNKAVSNLDAAKYRYLVGAIEGDETQHFIILAALIFGLADPGPNLNPTTGAQLPPKPFVNTVGTEPGLETLTAYYPS